MLQTATTKDTDIFDKMYQGSYYTITGAGGDLNEWVEGYNKILEEKGIGIPKEWYTFKGNTLNTLYALSGSNKYKRDITFLTFSLDGLDVSKLAMVKLQMGDRWFDDIVDNNVRREVECI